MALIKTQILVALATLFALQATANDCANLSINEYTTIKYVYDGDTFQTVDNRRIRLISINTPELSQNNQPAQALANEARQAAETFLSTANTVGLSFGARKADRYDRLLAHIVHPQRGSLEAHLVKLGLAFPIAVPPDINYSACLSKLADEAKQKQLGVWKHPYWQAIPAINTNQLNNSFRRVCGKITKIDRAGPLWIELEGDLVIRINKNDWPYFNNSEFDLNKAESWQNRNIELWGWLQDRRDQKRIIESGFKSWSIQARSPVVLRWVNQCY